MTSHAERLFVTWFTSAADGYDHAVTDDEAGRGFRTGTDAAAVCGERVVPVPLATPPGPGCLRCQAQLRAHAVPQALDPPIESPRRSRRKWSFIRRLWARQDPARSASQVPVTGPGRAPTAAPP